MVTLTLGIESSCDDTAAAVVDAEGRVLASLVARQLATHQPWGGVVPELASREHLAAWPALLAATLERSGVGIEQIGAVAATRGPGLLGSLLVGLSLGRGLAYSRDLPFHAVHHLEGHVYSPFLRLEGEAAENPPADFVALVVSGGHTSLYSVDAEGTIEALGETRDDAIGEVFDKVGKRLGLPYPGGPLVDRLAELGEAGGHLPVARCDGLDFSYSGLKSETIRAIQRLEDDGLVPFDHDHPPTAVTAVCADFRRAAVAQVLERLERLAATRSIPLLAVSGGAAANRLLRRELATWCARRDIPLRLVPLPYSADNAAMIAWAAVLAARRGERDDPRVSEASSRLPLGTQAAAG